MVTDMTVGKPWKVLLNFSLPLLFSSVFQQMYNIIDSIIAGQCISEEALAAVGASHPITMIFVAVAFGAAQGSSVVISQFFGARRYKDMKSSINTAYISIIILALVLTAVGGFLTTPILEAMGTPKNILGDSSTYLAIYIYGLVFVFLYNTTTSVFSALGDSRTPLYLLIGSSVGNVILDLLCVKVFNLGVVGLAVATFIAQAIAAITATIILVRRLRKIETDEKPERFSKIMLGKIVRVAIPSICQQSFVSVGNIFIQTLINSYDNSAIIAGYSAAGKVNIFAISAISAMSGGVANFTAQNIGAGREDRVKEGFKSSIIIAEAIAVVFTALFVLLGGIFVNMFMEEPSATAMATGLDFLHIVSPFYIFVSAKLIADSVLRGSGSMKCFMLSTFIDLFLRVAFAYLFSSFMGVVGIWWSWPIGWVIASALALFFYFRGYWKNRVSI